MPQTDYVILGLLSESPLTGYQIKKYIDLRFSYFWSESYGQLYPRLKALKDRGLIAEYKAGEEQARPQKTYRITDRGREALENWIALPVERETLRLEILLKLYFSKSESNEAILEHLRRFQQAHEGDYKTLKQFYHELEPIRELDNHDRVMQVIDFGLKVNAAYLRWCDETIEMLKGKV